MNDPMDWLFDAIDQQFGDALQAGGYAEYPALRQAWLEGIFAKAETAARQTGNFSEEVN
jgi:hypothetical protein